MVVSSSFDNHIFNASKDDFFASFKMHLDPYVKKLWRMLHSFFRENYCKVVN